MAKFVDITGMRFGKLLVVKFDSRKGHSSYFKCKCDCGNEKVINSYSIRKNKTRSCGCLVFENNFNFKHGMKNHKLYGVWNTMKSRCYNRNSEKYKNYGNRGITICDEWRSDFMEFYNWAIRNGYSEGLTIDRIDNYGNYEPSNCRWTTPKEQANNKTDNHKIEYNGEVHTISEWSEITGIKYHTIKCRINRYGWNPERAITEQSFVGKNQSFGKGKNE